MVFDYVEFICDDLELIWESLKANIYILYIYIYIYEDIWDTFNVDLLYKILIKIDLVFVTDGSGV